MEKVIDLSVLLAEKKLAASCAEARRLISSDAVSINNKVTDSSFIEESKLKNALITVGKHKMIQL